MPKITKLISLISHVEESINKLILKIDPSTPFNLGYSLIDVIGKENKLIKATNIYNWSQ